MGKGEIFEKERGGEQARGREREGGEGERQVGERAGGGRWSRNLQEPAELSDGPGGRRAAREEL